MFACVLYFTVYVIIVVSLNAYVPLYMDINDINKK